MDPKRSLRAFSANSWTERVSLSNARSGSHCSRPPASLRGAGKFTPQALFKPAMPPYLAPRLATATASNAWSVVVRFTIRSLVAHGDPLRRLPSSQRVSSVTDHSLATFPGVPYISRRYSANLLVQYVEWQKSLGRI